jgi:hypothetical protein
MEGILLPVTAFDGYREELYHVFTALSRERPGTPGSRKMLIFRKTKILH